MSGLRAAHGPCVTASAKRVSWKWILPSRTGSQAISRRLSTASVMPLTGRVLSTYLLSLSMPSGGCSIFVSMSGR